MPLVRTALVGFIALSAAGLALLERRSTPQQSYQVLRFETLPPGDFARDSYRFLPIYLREIYSALRETDEGAIYDELAQVSGGTALEQLYLARVGTMANGGLEPNQEIHDIALMDMKSIPAKGSTVRIAARWRVLGIVGHAEHMHMRGNTYAAVLDFMPIDGAWKLTGFSLTDVDRTEAGTLSSHAEAENGA